jgi:O-antigen/teichoic acid export membrane protein
MAVGLTLSEDTRPALVALGVCLPGLLVQDVCRMAFFSSGRADRAAINDGLWTVLEFAALAGVLVSGIRDVAVFILVWGGSATVAAVCGIAVLRSPPLLRGALGWLLAQRSLSGYLVAENILGVGLAQVGILMVGVVGSASDVGSLRAAQVLLGPLNIVVTAALLFGIPEVARRKTMSERDRWLFCWGLSAALCVVSLGYSAVLLLLPDSVGVHLLGDTWSGAQTVLLAMCTLSLAIAVGVGPGITLYGLGRVRTTFGLNLVKAPLLVVLLTVGIWWQGAVGAAWALAATEAALLPFVIAKALRAMHTPRPAASPDADLAAPTAPAGQ